MPNYLVEFTRTARMVVQAKSKDEVEAAIDGKTMDDLLLFPEDWEHLSYETTDDADSGVLNGTIVDISDMPTE